MLTFATPPTFIKGFLVIKRGLQKWFLLSALVTVFCYQAQASSAARCVQFFLKPIHPQINEAILKGVQLFDQQVDYSKQVDFAFSYFHGTSVESLARSARATHFAGSPVQDFTLLSNKFGFYNDHMVVHALQNRAGALNRRDLQSIATYAEMSAKRFYLLRFLKDSSLYNSFFLYDLIYTLKDRAPLADFLESQKSEGFFDQRPELLSLMENSDMTFLTGKVLPRKGIILVIDSAVQASVIIERDVEHDGAQVLISEQGIPLETIKAIIPQSRAERDELLNMMKDH